MQLTTQKLEGWGYRMVKISYPNQPFFYDIWQTDWRTDGRAIAYAL